MVGYWIGREFGLRLLRRFGPQLALSDYRRLLTAVADKRARPILINFRPDGSCIIHSPWSRYWRAVNMDKPGRQ